MIVVFFFSAPTYNVISTTKIKYTKNKKLQRKYIQYQELNSLHRTYHVVFICDIARDQIFTFNLPHSVPRGDVCKQSKYAFIKLLMARFTDF